MLHIAMMLANSSTECVALKHAQMFGREGNPLQYTMFLLVEFIVIDEVGS